MNSLSTIAWLFPIIFMIHDFEEIIFIESWKRKYKTELGAFKGKAPFSDFKSTPSFSCAVAEEFFIFSVITLISCLTNNYIVWFAFYFACIFHFVIHIVLCIRFHHYVPGITTSILLLPVGVYTLYNGSLLMQSSIQVLIACAVIGTALLLLNLKLLHKLMPTFEKYINIDGYTE